MNIFIQFGEGLINILRSIVIAVLFGLSGAVLSAFYLYHISRKELKYITAALLLVTTFVIAFLLHMVSQSLIVTLEIGCEEWTRYLLFPLYGTFVFFLIRDQIPRIKAWRQAIFPATLVTVITWGTSPIGIFFLILLDGRA